MRLLIGNRNYSSWSLRPWLALKKAGIPFEETVLPLYQPEFAAAVAGLSPTGKVPCLVVERTEQPPLVIWDSLAIGEYLAETFPAAQLWPQDPAARAVARAVCAEMHGGFQALRQAFMMNVRKSLPGKGWPEEPEARAAVEKDVTRINQIWSGLRQTYGAAGPFLFGHFSLADCFYAPVVFRCAIYDLPLQPLAQDYVQTMLALPEMQDWAAAAKQEPWVIDKFER